MTTANLKYYSELIGDDLIITDVEVRCYIWYTYGMYTSVPF